PAPGDPPGAPGGGCRGARARAPGAGERGGGPPPEAPAAPPAAAADGRLFLRALRYHWFLALTLGTLTASALAATAWFCFPAKYTTYSLLKVSGATPALLPTAGNGFASNEFVTYGKPQASLIRSSQVLTAALGEPAVAQLPTVRRQ